MPLLLTMKQSLKFMISLMTPLILQGDRGTISRHWLQNRCLEVLEGHPHRC